MISREETVVNDVKADVPSGATRNAPSSPTMKKVPGIKDILTNWSSVLQVGFELTSSCQARNIMSEAEKLGGGEIDLESSVREKYGERLEPRSELKLRPKVDSSSVPPRFVEVLARAQFLRTISSLKS